MQQTTDLPVLADLAYLEADVVLKRLETSRDGLSEKEVLARQARYGRNVIAHESAPAWHQQLGRAFANPFNALLATLAVVSISTGDQVAALIIQIVKRWYISRFGTWL